MIHVIWDLDDDASGNVCHIPIDEYLTKDDVEHAVNNAIWSGTSKQSNRPLILGLAESGGLLAVIYEHVDKETIYPITAYYVENP